MKKFNKFNLPLIALLLISFFVRIYKINNLSLFGDEIDVGYQAYSLLQTGHDYKGNFLPTYIQSLSESRAPLLIYFTVPGIKIFGLTETGVRIAPIIFGVLSIYLLYKLIFLFSKSNSLSLLSATALSFSPWHFHYSRTAFEVTLLLSLILLGTYLFEKFIATKKSFLLFLSIISFGLTFYTYNTANIFIPLLVIFLLLSNFKNLKSQINFKNTFTSLLLTLFLLLPILNQIFSGNAANRFNLISIFHDQKIIDQIINKRTSFSATSPQTEALFHNKATAWIGEFTKNYLSSLSLPFLFISGDQVNLRHSIPDFGLIFVIFLPFLLVAFLNLDLKNRLNQIMLFWLTISPIASSLTSNGANHATRLFLMTVPLAYFSALGILKISNIKNIFSKVFLLISSIVLIIQVIAYGHEYFIHYPKDSFEVWDYGYQQLFKSIPKNNQNIFVSNAKYNSLLPYVFYQKYSPTNNFLKDNQQENIFQDLSGFQLDKNIFFINDFHSQDHLEKINTIAQSGDVFLLFQGSNIPGDMDFSQKPLNGFETIKTVYNPNQSILGQVIQKL